MEQTDEHNTQIANDQSFYSTSSDEEIVSSQQCPQSFITNQRPIRCGRPTFNVQSTQCLNQKLHELQKLDVEISVVTDRLKNLRERKERLKKLMNCLRRIDAIESQRKHKQFRL